MAKIFTVAQIREIEKRAFECAPSFVVMTRAGEAVAEESRRMIRPDDSRPILAVAGPGNNGGDAFIAAARLKNSGMKIRVAFFGDRNRLSSDATQAMDEWLVLGGKIESEIPGDNFSLVIDGIFGIGANRPISGAFAELISRINKLSAPKLAVDIPSGLCADTGKTLADTGAIACAKTVTFFGLKPGLLTADGLDFTGKIITSDLDFADSLTLENAGELIDGIKNASRLRRRCNSNKGNFGALAVVGGADGMGGALALASRSAVALGAGKVFAVALGTGPPFDPFCPEIMRRRELPDEFNSIAIGVGMGDSEKARAILTRALESSAPAVIDADALNIISRDSSIRKLLMTRQAQSIVTPHPAEAGRILNCDAAAIQADRIAAARQIASELNSVVVLKGGGSVFATPKDAWGICQSGNPGLAQAGSGDVLTGIIGALLAQTHDAVFSAKYGMWLHGAAADKIAQEEGEIGLNINRLAAVSRQLLNAAVNKAR